MATLLEQMIQAQLFFQEELLRKTGVVGVAVGYKTSNGETTEDLAIVALVQEKKPISALSEADLLPSDINGAPVDVFESGEIWANQGPRDRFRPTIPPGVSIGHHLVTAGTLGAIVKDRNTGEKLILSNNHVLANSNNAAVGDPILQPGRADGGQHPADVVARLERFVQLHYQGDPPPPPSPPDQPENPGCDPFAVISTFGKVLTRLNKSDTQGQSSAKPESAPTESAQAALDNEVDAALAKPNDPAMFDDSIRHIGQITGTSAASFSLRVRKAGRTTDYTEGTINLLNATVNVNYNTSAGTRVGRFTGQVIASPMSQGGDSGSLIVELGANNAVGLLFAGSGTATIFTPIQQVLDALNVTF